MHINMALVFGRGDASAPYEFCKWIWGLRVFPFTGGAVGRANLINGFAHLPLHPEHSELAIRPEHPGWPESTGFYPFPARRCHARCLEGQLGAALAGLLCGWVCGMQSLRGY